MIKHPQKYRPQFIVENNLVYVEKNYFLALDNGISLYDLNYSSLVKHINIYPDTMIIFNNCIVSGSKNSNKLIAYDLEDFALKYILSGNTLKLLKSNRKLFSCHNDHIKEWDDHFRIIGKIQLEEDIDQDFHLISENFILSYYKKGFDFIFNIWNLETKKKIKSENIILNQVQNITFCNNINDIALFLVCSNNKNQKFNEMCLLNLKNFDFQRIEFSNEILTNATLLNDRLLIVFNLIERKFGQEYKVYDFKDKIILEQKEMNENGCVSYYGNLLTIPNFEIWSFKYFIKPKIEVYQDIFFKFK